MPEFPRPLGLVLSGGGALGAWQAGALEALDAAGLRFDAVLGFSIGALNGAALAFGRLGEALARWRGLDGGILTLKPRLAPPSLFSDAPLRDFFPEARDDARARRELRTPLVVVSADPAAGEAVYARFSPGGDAGWDGRLDDHLAASCAVPLIFPPVDLEYRGRRRRLIDGGVPQPTPFRFDALGPCRSVLVLEMARADEMGRRCWEPYHGLDQVGRESCREVLDEGTAFLLRSDSPPAVYRVAPSERLTSVMLDFSARSIRPRLPLGARDAGAFLSGPERFRVR